MFFVILFMNGFGNLPFDCSRESILMQSTLKYIINSNTYCNFNANVEMRK